VLAERRGEGVEIGLGPQVGIEPAVVAHVIAVTAAGAGKQDGRGVAVSNTQGVQVRDEVAGVPESEGRVELEAIGSRGDSPGGQGRLDQGGGFRHRCGPVATQLRDRHAQLFAQGQEAVEPAPHLLLAGLSPFPQLGVGRPHQFAVEALGLGRDSGNGPPVRGSRGRL